VAVPGGVLLPVTCTAGQCFEEARP
jgi:hypothetical protein